MKEGAGFWGDKGRWGWEKRCSRRKEPNSNLNSDVGCTRIEGEGLGLATPMKMWVEEWRVRISMLD